MLHNAITLEVLNISEKNIKNEFVFHETSCLMGLIQYDEEIEDFSPGHPVAQRYLS
jgi:hypothetical protein